MLCRLKYLDVKRFSRTIEKEIGKPLNTIPDAIYLTCSFNCDYLKHIVRTLNSTKMHSI